MMKQKTPMGGFKASASGGLHDSSVGATYPWSVQPRVRITGDVVETRWIVFNALTGKRSLTFAKYDEAAALMQRVLDYMAAHASDMERAQACTVEGCQDTLRKGRFLPNVRR